jgi:hypothetical protein
MAIYQSQDFHFHKYFCADHIFYINLNTHLKRLHEKTTTILQ